MLAAGLGTRLRPLTRDRPKPLCPVAGRPLLSWALERTATGAGDLAVNLFDRPERFAGYVPDGVHVSVERELLGTAGALARLRPWLDGRGALVVNADTWCPGDLAGFVGGWDGERVRVLVAGEDELRATSLVAAALLPWVEVAGLVDEPSGLWARSWAPALAAGRLEAVRHDGPVHDCGTPARYLAANLAATGGSSAVGEGAVVAGEVVRSVVWDGAVVRRGERLVDAIRYGRGTVLVRSPGS